MSGFEYPDLPKRLDELKEAVAWASGVKTVWIDQNDGGVVRKTNKPWIELRPKRFQSIGTGEIRSTDLETALTEGTLDYPRQELLVDWYEVFFEARCRSRKQEHKVSAWYAGLQFKTRIRSSYALHKWLKPMQFSIVDIGDVMNMPEIKTHDGRVEDAAIIEFSLNTVVCEIDTAGLGTWIDRCLVTSDITPLDDTLQLDDKVMGWADAVYVVDTEGNFVVDEHGNFILEG